jgi:large subunit ribosomal protein L17
MKKHVFGRHFKRDANERKALFKNLLTSLVIEERITTTEAKAKAIRAAADKLVTKAKKGGPDAFRSLAPDVRYDAVAKLVNTIAPRFVQRQGGYTRIIKIGHRVADNAPQVIMEWVDRPEAVVEVKTKGSSPKSSASNDQKKKDAKAKDEKKSTVAVVKPVTEQKVSKMSPLKKLVTRQKKG